MAQGISMSDIGPIGPGMMPGGRGRTTPHPNAAVAADKSRASGRALVPLDPTAPTNSLDRAAARASAPFLAHLIATAQQAPQTRARRRAEPGEAIAAYSATKAAAKGSPGFSRSL